jgi:hypothetical protein
MQSPHARRHQTPEAIRAHSSGRVIHMDHQDVWLDLELAPRFNLTMTCKQIHQETELMFHANNTFLFQSRVRTSNYDILEDMANWLYELRDRERETIGRIVVCSKLAPNVDLWVDLNLRRYCDVVGFRRWAGLGCAEGSLQMAWVLP